jgi:hypothetical protein
MMENLVQKIGKTMIAEIVEAILFIMLLLLTSILPQDNIKEQMIRLVLILWAVAGVSTPFIIFLEIEDRIAELFKNLFP